MFSVSFQLEGHREPHNKISALSPAEYSLLPQIRSVTDIKCHQN